jgi:hypothetical protein
VGDPGVACPAGRFCSEGACAPCTAFSLAKSATSSGRIPVSTKPVALATGDLNGDGKVDLLVANYGTLDVYRGSGDGGFQPLQRIAYGTGSSSFAVTDMDGDGHLDVVLANDANNGQIVILYGYGDGTLDPSASVIRPNQPPSAPRIADLNADGKPDIVFPARFLKGFGVLLNQGPRTFAPVIMVDTKGFPPVAAATGDFDGNGKVDIALATNPSINYLEDPATVEVLLGKPDGSFGPKQTYPGGSKGFDIATADLNGDGKSDLVTADGSSLSLYFGSGDGKFAAPKRLLAFPGTWQVIAADISGDGIVDLVTRTNDSSSATASFVVRIGLGDGTFFPAQTYPGGTGGIAVADVNGDGRADVIAGNQITNDVTVYFGIRRPECK